MNLSSALQWDNFCKYFNLLSLQRAHERCAMCVNCENTPYHTQTNFDRCFNIISCRFTSLDGYTCMYFYCRYIPQTIHCSVACIMKITLIYACMHIYCHVWISLIHSVCMLICAMVVHPIRLYTRYLLAAIYYRLSVHISASLILLIQP